MSKKPNKKQELKSNEEVLIQEFENEDGFYVKEGAKINHQRYSAANPEKLFMGIFLLFFACVILFVVISVTTKSAMKDNTVETIQEEYNQLVEEEVEIATDAAVGESASPDEATLMVWGDSFISLLYENSAAISISLNEKTQMPVYVAANPGDSLKMIAARQGGMPAIVSPVTIPAGSEPVEIVLNSPIGGGLTPALDVNAGLNPCFIGGVEGNIYYGSKNKLMFKRIIEGEEVVISEPTSLQTKGMTDNLSAYQLIFVGEKYYGSNADEIVSIYQKMVDAMPENSLGYLIVGNISGSRITHSELEGKMQAAFGDNYLNLRDYLTTTVFEEYPGLVLNDEQTQQANNGIVPGLFLEGNVFSADGAYIVSDVIYNKLKALGYCQ